MNRAHVTLLHEMPGQRSPNVVQVTLRLDAEQMKRVEAIAEKLSRPGIPQGRTDALRYIIALGIEAADEALASRGKTKR